MKKYNKYTYRNTNKILTIFELKKILESFIKLNNIKNKLDREIVREEIEKKLSLIKKGITIPKTRDINILIYKIVNYFKEYGYNSKQILSILNKNNVNVTFFVSKDIFDNNLNIVKQIIDNGNEVELLSDNYTIYEVNKYNSMIKMISNNKLLFCMNKEKNNELLNSCETTKLYSIVPKQNINNLYSYMKNNLENGMIILLSNKKSIVNELSSTLSYIKQKGKNLILLKSILE